MKRRSSRILPWETPKLEDWGDRRNQQKKTQNVASELGGEPEKCGVLEFKKFF